MTTLPPPIGPARGETVPTAGFEPGARVLDLEHELARRKTTVGDALEKAIGQTDDVALRRQLLAFRRDVFNLRAPRDRGARAAESSQLTG